MDITLNSHQVGCGWSKLTPWNAAAETKDPTDSQIEDIPNLSPGEGVLTCGYNTVCGGHHIGVVGFSTTSFGGSLPAFQSPPEEWMSENFSGVSEHQKTEILLPQPYRDRYDMAPNMLCTTTDSQHNYGLISSSSIPPASETSDNPARAPEDVYQHPPTSVLYPSASDANSMIIVPSLSPPPATISYAALLPDQHSKYSELSANLAYMSALSVPHEAGLSKEKRSTGIERRKKEKSTVKAKEKHYGRVFELPEASTGLLLSVLDWSGIQPAVKSNAPKLSLDEGIENLRIPQPTTYAAGAKLGKTNKPPPPKHIPPPRSVCREGSSYPGASSPGKKLGLACLFCRERKIACGRPSGSNPDQTCNQCARRLFKCEYPTESRRGQYKRSKANMAPPRS